MKKQKGVAEGWKLDLHEKETLCPDFSEIDGRYWTISIDPELKIFCTCFKENGEEHFEFWDGGNRIPGKFVIKTKSMNVIFNHLNSIKNREE